MGETRDCKEWLIVARLIFTDTNGIIVQLQLPYDITKLPI